MDLFPQLARLFTAT